MPHITYRRLKIDIGYVSVEILQPLPSAAETILRKGETIRTT